jgi:asparagine synthetase B (glutamine-hydrolysing)
VSQRLFDLTKNCSLDETSLIWFLTLGYVPGNKTLFTDVACLPGGAQLDVGPGVCKEVRRFRYEELISTKYEGWDEESLIGEGILTWQQTMSGLFRDSSHDPVVLLSGGLDSRAVLAGLLEHCEARNIHTYTFGTPGTWDYDIGCFLAKQLGTRHKTFDLRKIPFTHERMHTILDLIDGIVHMGRPHDEMVRDIDPSSTVWSGFLGDSMAGGNLPLTFSDSPESHFLTRNRYAKSVLDLAKVLVGTSISEDDIRHFPSAVSNLSYDTLDLYQRQERYVAHVCFPRGLDWKAPFLERQWLAFALSLPTTHRRNQTLYKKILVKAFPKLYSWPTRNNFGNPLDEASTWGSNFYRIRRKVVSRLGGILSLGKGSGGRVMPDIEYINFREGIRRRKDLYHLVKENIERLQHRNFLNNQAIHMLWEEHQASYCNHARALMLLTCLETIIQAGQANP